MNMVIMNLTFAPTDYILKTESAVFTGFSYIISFLSAVI